MPHTQSIYMCNAFIHRLCIHIRANTYIRVEKQRTCLTRSRSICAMHVHWGSVCAWHAANCEHAYIRTYMHQFGYIHVQHTQHIAWQDSLATHLRLRIRTCTYADTHDAHTHTHTHTHKHTHTHTHIHTHTHTHTHARTHTHTHKKDPLLQNLLQKFLKIQHCSQIQC